VQIIYLDSGIMIFD